MMLAEFVGFGPKLLGVFAGGGGARSCPMHALFINGWGAESADGILIVDFCFGLVFWEGLTTDV